MDDDTRSKDLTLPEDEPWMSHGFISKIVVAQPQSFTPNPQRIEHRTGAQQPDRWA